MLDLSPVPPPGHPVAGHAGQPGPEHPDRAHRPDPGPGPRLSPAPHVLPANCCSMPWRTRCWAVARCPVSRPRLLASSLAEVAAALDGGRRCCLRTARRRPGSPGSASGGPSRSGGRWPTRVAPWASRAVGQRAERQTRARTARGASCRPLRSSRRSTEPGSCWPGWCPGSVRRSCSVFAWGWESRPRAFRPGQPFSWWARDDAGRWHVGRWPPMTWSPARSSWSSTRRWIPRRQSLDIILTGRSSQVTATLPLAPGSRLAESARSRYIVLTDELTGPAARRLVARAGTGRPRGQARRLVERAGTPAEVGVTTPAERAETYLRLMAESELRRALAYPRYESPGSAGAALRRCARRSVFPGRCSPRCSPRSGPRPGGPGAAPVVDLPVVSSPWLSPRG